MCRQCSCLLFAAFLIVAQTGCRGDQDRKPLKELLENLAEAVKYDFQDEIKTHPREEWAVRRGALMAQRDITVIDEFTKKYPQLSNRAKAAVDSVREVDREWLELFEGAIKTGRFKLTESEKDDLSKVMNERMQRLLVIGRIVDGDE